MDVQEVNGAQQKDMLKEVALSSHYMWHIEAEAVGCITLFHMFEFIHLFMKQKVMNIYFWQYCFNWIFLLNQSRQFRSQIGLSLFSTYKLPELESSMWVAWGDRTATPLAATGDNCQLSNLQHPSPSLTLVVRGEIHLSTTPQALMKLPQVGKEVDLKARQGTGSSYLAAYLREHKAHIAYSQGNWELILLLPLWKVYGWRRAVLRFWIWQPCSCVIIFLLVMRNKTEGIVMLPPLPLQSLFIVYSQFKSLY